MTGLQSFVAATRPDQGPPRLAALRTALAEAGLDGFLVPRADRHQGEYVAACDERLAWLTGFTGSAGLAVVLPHAAGLFVDGRYRVQARQQVDTGWFAPIDWPAVQPGDWLRAQAPNGAVVGFDPWLHTADEIARLDTRLQGSGIVLRRAANPIDRLWTDRPPPPAGPVRIHPEALAGEASRAKRQRLAEALRGQGQRAAVLTLPDSVCWLLNIRGSDIPRTPVVQAMAILHDDARVTLFLDPARIDAALAAHLDIGGTGSSGTGSGGTGSSGTGSSGTGSSGTGSSGTGGGGTGSGGTGGGGTGGGGVTPRPPEAFEAALRTLPGPVRVDPATAPVAVLDALQAAGVAVARAPDPCLLPKARKNAAELAGSRAAHRRDAAAMVEFLAWLDARAAAVCAGTGRLTEIDAVRRLEALRRRADSLHDISFETIAGSGPHGAIVHYRVTEATDRAVAPGELLLIDSGGQYPDGTTDVTRTVAIGPPPAAAVAAYTRVLQGMIAISRLRWPAGLAGCHLDALARYPLWLAGQDYDHGTGHGVGAFLGVHEGPQRLARSSDVPLEPGMILSNEPGYYREGAFGIRIENLVAVTEAPALPGADDRPMLAFETLTWVPLDRRLIDAGALAAPERAWLDSYHAEVRARVAPAVSAAAADWLTAACAPI